MYLDEHFKLCSLCNIMSLEFGMEHAQFKDGGGGKDDLEYLQSQKHAGKRYYCECGYSSV